MARPRREPLPTEAELTRQTLERLQEQMHQFTIAMQAMAGQRAPPPPNVIADNDDDEEEKPICETASTTAGRLPVVDERWEQGFKSELPEFHGRSTAEELLDWIVTVEEVLKFKRVPLDRCVPVIAMRFRNRAATWWAPLKTT